MAIVSSFGATDCGEPGVYMELLQAHLAWIASEVPSVSEAWGSCRINGRSGKPAFHYVYRGSSGNSDGPYRWAIYCKAISTSGGGDSDSAPTTAGRGGATSLSQPQILAVPAVNNRAVVPIFGVDLP